MDQWKIQDHHQGLTVIDTWSLKLVSIVNNWKASGISHCSSAGLIEDTSGRDVGKTALHSMPSGTAWSANVSNRMGESWESSSGRSVLGAGRQSLLSWSVLACTECHTGTLNENTPALHLSIFHFHGEERFKGLMVSASHKLFTQQTLSEFLHSHHQGIAFFLEGATFPLGLV